MRRWTRMLASSFIGKKLFQWVGGQVREGTRRKAKWPFIVIPLLYWIFPDLMPFLPWDDLVVTLISWLWYRGSSKPQDPKSPNDNSHPKSNKNPDIIDIEAKVITEDDDSDKSK